MVNDARLKQLVMLQIHFEAFPIERRLLTAPIKPLENQLLGNLMEPLNSPAVSTDTIVLIVTPEFRSQYWPPRLEFRSVAYFPEPLIHLLVCPTKSLGT